MVVLDQLSLTGLFYPEVRLMNVQFTAAQLWALVTFGPIAVVLTVLVGIITHKSRMVGSGLRLTR
jgi:hypothetical protein